MQMASDCFHAPPFGRATSTSRDTPETVDVLEYHVLLVERIQETVVFAKSCKFKMLLKDTKAERMERADIHLIDVCHDGLDPTVSFVILVISSFAAFFS